MLYGTESRTKRKRRKRKKEKDKRGGTHIKGTTLSLPPPVESALLSPFSTGSFFL